MSKTKLPSSELFLSQKNDVLIPSSGETKIDIAKASCVLLDNIALGGDLNVLRSNENGIFLSYMLNGVCKTEIAKKAQGDTVVHLYASQLKLLGIIVPNEPEQQKIADCLSSIDELLTLEAQKLDTLKTHKKGLMQQLFPAEGEIVPKLRFPEFLEAGKWEERKVEELARRGSGHTPSKRKPDYYNGGIKWVSLADSNKLDDRYIYETKVEISKEGLENSSAVLHPSGTVIISRDAGVGKSAILHSAMAVSQHFIVWLCDKSKLSNWFLYYFLQILKPKFENIATGSTIKTIGLSYFKEFCISIPSIPEQQKIAACLTSLDDLVTTQTQKLATLKTHKKGLMQQLFPHTST
ncbi:MAG: restriction endonuclease subunit S [Candidatus Electrothrix sp. AR5]|nr:restriction endonuclease subunit S [Candidatus Electrothrix sp. AR5]